MIGPAAGNGGEADGDARLPAARALLERAGVRGAVSAAGGEREIVVVRGPARLRSRLAELAPGLRALGFRFVTLELDDGTTYDEGT